MKWAITLSYFTFEARFWTNFGFDCCHLLGSCQSENFEVFFCYPFGFLLGRLLYFSFLIIYAYLKTSPGHSLFLVLWTLYLFWSFCFMLFTFFFLVLWSIFVVYFVIPCNWICHLVSAMGDPSEASVSHDWRKQGVGLWLDSLRMWNITKRKRGEFGKVLWFWYLHADD